MYMFQFRITDEVRGAYLVCAETEKDGLAIVHLALGLPDFEPSSIVYHRLHKDTYAGDMSIAKGTGYFDTRLVDWDSPFDLHDTPYIPFNVRKHFIDLALEYLEES